MPERRFYLKQNVLVEPLFNRWYAWAYLIAPATAAMYVANLHLKIMQSFVAAPNVHASALQTPALRGGPFIHYDTTRLDDIKRLLDKTTTCQSDLLLFAAALKTADDLLAAEADGRSLEPLYRRLPDVLKGYVELVYDLNNHPSLYG